MLVLWTSSQLILTKNENVELFLLLLSPLLLETYPLLLLLTHPLYSGPRAQRDVRAPVLSAESAPTLAPAAAAPLHVCNCYTKCQGICVNAPIEGPRKRLKKEEPPLFLPLSVRVCDTTTGPWTARHCEQHARFTHTSRTLHIHFTHTSHTLHTLFTRTSRTRHTHITRLIVSLRFF